MIAFNDHLSTKVDLALAVVLASLAFAPWPPLQRAISPLRDTGPNLAEVERTERGYYEALIDSNRRLDIATEATSQDAGLEWGEPAGLASAGLPFVLDPRVMPVDDIREFALRPDFSSNQRNRRWTNNSWGLRDREYTRLKPANTLRIALLGDSIGAGWGVADDRSFEALLENKLNNASLLAGKGNLEILNFSVPGYAPGQRWENFQRLAGWSCGVDLVIYEATVAEPAWDERRLRRLLANGVGWDAPQYAPALAPLRTQKGADDRVRKDYLRAHRWQILESVYANIAIECRARGIACVWILIPRVGKPTEKGARDRLVRLAKRVGFDVVADFSDVFDGVDPTRLAVSPNDYHPNELGHAKLADRLYELMRVRLELSPAGDTP
jgi:lysophospholipase L1-like esterase